MSWINSEIIIRRQKTSLRDGPLVATIYEFQFHRSIGMSRINSEIIIRRPKTSLRDGSLVALIVSSRFHRSGGTFRVNPQKSIFNIDISTLKFVNTNKPDS